MSLSRDEKVKRLFQEKLGRENDYEGSPPPTQEGPGVPVLPDLSELQNMANYFRQLGIIPPPPFIPFMSFPQFPQFPVSGSPRREDEELRRLKEENRKLKSRLAQKQLLKDTIDETALKKCQYCGFMIAKDADTCSRCGAYLYGPRYKPIE